MRAILWVLIYLILGGIHLVFTWDEDVDDFYAKLKRPLHAVFVSGSIVLWLPLFVHAVVGWLGRQRWKSPEERL